MTEKRAARPRKVNLLPWTQLHGYYLTEKSADEALRARRESAWDRARFAPEDRPRYRRRSRTVGRQGATVDGRRMYPGETYYWIEQAYPTGSGMTGAF